MRQVVDVSQMCQLPTWNAFNSLLTETPSVTLCETLPLSPISPTDWTVLYAALKQAQEINMKVFPNKKSIVTLDLQLYAKCMELRSRNKIKYKLIFKLEELNIVFAFLKVLGKYINCCGLDQILVDTDTYGSTTLSQILNGKHMKQGFEAHIILCLSLSNLFYNDLLKVYPLTQLNLADELAKLKGNIQSSKEFLKDLFNESLSKVQDDGLLKKIKQFDEGLNYQAKFLHNYMKMFEVLLLFIRASREENWELHLAFLELTIPYFFA